MNDYVQVCFGVGMGSLDDAIEASELLKARGPRRVWPWSLFGGSFTSIGTDLISFWAIR